MIKKLPEEVVRKIASGQIAESPRAVLKELIENALDSGASSVKVEIETPFSFKVSDNGFGIRYKELPICIQRFTTSKIREINDLKRLRTYGFRGEALYAISQFSQLTIKSKNREEKVGGLLKVIGGEVKEYKPLPLSGGTVVEVKELFFNAPVRKKATSQREKGQMVKLVSLYAMCHPDIEFSIQGKKLFRSSLKERVFRLTGIQFQISVSGRLKLFFSKEERGIKQVFINRRPVTVPEIEKLVEEKRIGSYILFIEIEPHLVDFNVSPLKDRVFIEDRKLIEEVEGLLKEELSLPKLFTVKVGSKVKYNSPIELIGSDGTVIVAHDRENYYFFDQHLIHERVNYEKLLEKLKRGELPLTEVHPPVELSREFEEELLKVGAKFVVEGDRLIVYEIPEILKPEELKSLNLRGIETVAQIACRRAVKGGYKVKDWKDLKELFNEYLSCKERETCPHGRPIYYKIPKRRIYNQLGRKLK